MSDSYLHGISPLSYQSHFPLSRHRKGVAGVSAELTSETECSFLSTSTQPRVTSGQLQSLCPRCVGPTWPGAVQMDTSEACKGYTLENLLAGGWIFVAGRHIYTLNFLFLITYRFSGFVYFIWKERDTNPSNVPASGTEGLGRMKAETLCSLL